MASKIEVDGLAGAGSAGVMTVVGEGGSTTTSLQQGLAKSWITFTSAASFTNRDSFNVSSLGDGGAGSGTVTMTSAMSSTYHTVQAQSSNNHALTDYGGNGHTTTVYKCFSMNSGQSLTDASAQYGSVEGDLA
jgi:hypothetical protein